MVYSGNWNCKSSRFQIESPALVENFSFKRDDGIFTGVENGTPPNVKVNGPRLDVGVSNKLLGNWKNKLKIVMNGVRYCIETRENYS